MCPLKNEILNKQPGVSFQGSSKGEQTISKTCRKQKIVRAEINEIEKLKIKKKLNKELVL